MGRLLGDLSSSFQQRILNPTTDTLRLALYACHDTSIGGLLNALQCFDDKWPAFTAYMSFELFTKTKDEKPASWLSGLRGFGSIKPDLKDHFVRIRYNSKDLKIPACQLPDNHLEGSEGTVCTRESDRERVENKLIHA